MRKGVCALLFVLVLAPLRAPAQATGTIQGSVYDASGAVIAEAMVTATHTATGLKRMVLTDGTGAYVVPLLPVGVYQVEVRKSGFAPFVQREVRLEVNTTVQVTAHLDVQTAAEQVTISADATLVQTTTTNLVQVIDERRITELPLNGRNVLQLMTLSSGVSDRGAQGGTFQVNTLSGGSHHVAASLNGSRGNATNFLLDNADNNDLYTNVSNPYPNPDAVQEFSIQTSTFDAQYGRGIGGVVNVVTRSGTNQLHGSAFEFLRNNKLNAGNFFSGKDTLKRNQFGFTVGGPVVLPHLYDGRNRTFVFGAYQGTRERVATPGALATAPTQAIKAGDLSAFLRPDGTGAIKDPASPGAYFAGNIIPTNRFDPVSANLLRYMPAAASTDYQLRYATPTRATNDDQIMVRADQYLGSRQRAAVRYFRYDFDRPWSFIPSNLYFVSAGQQGVLDTITFNHTFTISPRLVNETTFSYYNSTPTAAPPADLDVSFDKLGARTKSVPGFPTMDLAISNWTGISLGLGYFNGQRQYQFADTVGYATGKHNLRAGVDYKDHMLDKSSYFLSGGSATFTGQLSSDAGRSNAGNAFADFLLGQVGTWRQQSPWAEHLYTKYFALFVQDDIRLTPRLTVNLGLRWDPRFDSSEAEQKRTTFVPGRQSTRFRNAPLGLLFQGDAGYEDSIIATDWNNLAPRVGLAYQVGTKLVVRAAYGIFYDQPPGIANNRSAQAEPFIVQTLLTATSSLANVYGNDEPLAPVLPNPDQNFVFRPFGTWAVPSRDMVTGYMQNWNFVVERQFGSAIVARAAYVGSKGLDLLHSPEINPALYGPGATAANLNQRRPYQPLGPVQLGRSDAWSKYHSMQLTLQKRYARGLTATANYTWSKSTDLTSYGSIEGNTTGPNPFNFRDNQGPSDFDTTHRLVASGIWEIPLLERNRLLVRSLVGGWQINAIFTAQTGQPVTVLSGVDNALTGVGGNFADYNGGDWHMPGGRTRGEQVQRWFNTAVFKSNAVGTIGTGRRNQLRAPGAWNADASFVKNFALAERAKLQFRAEFFNVFNHTRLDAPVATATNPNFGRITSALAPRIGQLGLRLVF